MPQLAIVAPPVPAMMISSADGLMNAAGLVPSIIALIRMPTIATAIPMPVAAFMTP